MRLRTGEGDGDWEERGALGRHVEKGPGEKDDMGSDDTRWNVAARSPACQAATRKSLSMSPSRRSDCSRRCVGCAEMLQGARCAIKRPPRNATTAPTSVCIVQGAGRPTQNRFASQSAIAIADAERQSAGVMICAALALQSRHLRGARRGCGMKCRPGAREGGGHGSPPAGHRDRSR